MPQKAPAIVTHPDLPFVYDACRKCIAKYPDGTTKELADSFRMTLGFEKMRRLVTSLDITSEDIVLSLFGGPGGTVRMLSLLKPRLLIATDILYTGKLASLTGWHFAADVLFDQWVKELSEHHIQEPQQIRYPMYMQLDVLNPEPVFDKAIDKVIIDPPYGMVTERLFGITRHESKRIFVAALVLAERCLVMNGMVSCLCPKEWIDDSFRNEIPLQIIDIELVGKSERFVLIRLTK